MIDRYSKLVLTVIAIALVVQIAQRATQPSAAQYTAVCSPDTPCPVYTVFKDGRNGDWHPCYQKKEAC